MNWTAYNELAWTEPIMAPPESCGSEAAIYIEAIKEASKASSLLHMGCGAGGHDYHFKQHFAVTGVDISRGMLDVAKKTNPEVTYIEDDMRTVQLGQTFDAVVIPDSIMYMCTLADLKQAITNAARHLKAGGTLLFVTHTREDFQENNFVYTGQAGNIQITVFENNFIVSDSTYEAAIIHLIREDKKLSVFHEVHTLGLFAYDMIVTTFKDCGFTVRDRILNHLYDPYLQDGGTYKLKIFIGSRSA